MSSPASSESIQIRPAKPEDASVCGRIFYEAFATINRSHNFPLEIPTPEAGMQILGMLFSHPGFYCVVAESEGRLVGSNCLDERSVICGLGPISVDPDVQNRGIGASLMVALLDRARQRGTAGVRLLQAAFHNRSLSLYAKLGFEVREPMSVMQGRAVNKPVEGCAVRPATMDDLEMCNRICEHVHGFPRAGELREGISQGTARIVERHDRVTGYASGFGYFGHAVGETNLDLEILIGAADNLNGPGMIVPTRNAALFRWCLAQGMRVVQPMTLMTIGLYNEPSGPYLPSVLF